MDSLNDWRRTHYTTDVGPEADGTEVIIFGWIEDIRDLGGITFLSLKDKSGSIQITVPKDLANISTIKKVDSLQDQSVIAVKGWIRKMERAPRGVEILPQEIRVFSNATHPLPFDPTGRVPADLDVRLDARVLDLRRPTSRAIFTIRHRVLHTIRDFFHSNGHIEVNTPKIIATATEGGAELFPIAYFDREAFLAQSPQLYKEQLSSVFEKVYEIAPIYRAEESHTTRHLSECISIDMEEAFVNYDDVMTKLESLTCEVVSAIRKNCELELKVLNHDLPLPSRPFKKYKYTDIVEKLKEFGVEIKWGEDISTGAFRILGKIFKGFYYIIDWPTESKPFYVKPCVDTPKVCEAFDLMHSWLELASGGTRVSDKELLVKRLTNQGLTPSSFEYHLKAYEYGMPPHAGFGLGLERLLMIMTGVKNIREVTIYPRDRFRLKP
jgi:aspartyl-tRNA synthetase